MNEYESAEVVRDTGGRQYHLGLSPEEVADKIIMVGDPKRARMAADQFDKIFVSQSNREFVAYTGQYRGMELTVLATGIGCDNTEIAVIELCQLRFPLTMIRCGSCGALQPEIKIGDLVISSSALRLENTSTFFVEEGYPAVAHHEVVLAILKAATDLGFAHHLGITATASGFYGAQGRQIPGFPVRDSGLMNRLTKQGIKNFEMESSTLFTLASLRGFRAGTVCAAFASRPSNTFIAPEDKAGAEMRAIQTTLKAMEILDQMDQAKGKGAFWLPSI